MVYYNLFANERNDLSEFTAKFLQGCSSHDITQH